MIPEKWAQLPYLMQRGRYEWSAACPKCGDSGHTRGTGQPDRFRIFTDKDVRGWCRRCGHFEWGDGRDFSTLSPQELAKLEADRKLSEARDRAASAYMKQNIRKLPWKEWAKDKRGVPFWEEAGIREDWQGFWMLGYVEDRFEHPALTIPYRNSNGGVDQIQYRILADCRDKYRFESGVTAGMFLTRPDLPIGNSILVTEGVKKACVTYMYIHERDSPFDTVIAMPSKKIVDDFYYMVDGSKQVTVCFDPDATTEAQKEAELLARQGAQVRIAYLPDKLDDLVNRVGIGTVLTLLRQARRVT